LLVVSDRLGAHGLLLQRLGRFFPGEAQVSDFFSDIIAPALKPQPFSLTFLFISVVKIDVGAAGITNGLRILALDVALQGVIDHGLIIAAPGLMHAFPEPIQYLGINTNGYAGFSRVWWNGRTTLTLAKIIFFTHSIVLLPFL